MHYTPLKTVLQPLSPYLFILLTMLSQWVAAQEFKVGGYHYPPFMYEQTNKGIYPDILSAIAERTGIQVQWHYYPYVRLSALFNKGDIHIEMGSSPLWTQAAKVQGIYSQPFYTLKDVAVFRMGDSTGSTEIEGQRIGMVRGYSFPQFQPKFDSGLAIRVDAPNELHLIRLLLNRRVDQIFISQDLLRYHQNNNPELGSLQVGHEVGRYDIAIRIHPHSKELVEPINQALEKMKASNQIQTIIEQYLTQ